MLNQRSARLAVLLLATMIAACARTPVEPTEWPGDLPPIDYYKSVYAQDEVNRTVQPREEYLKWVVRFYKGWDLYQDGWQMVTQDTLLAIDDAAAKHRVEQKLDHLGKLISGEWAKNTDGRKIQSRELSIWGQALLKSINRDEEEELVDQVTRDVDALLADELDRIEINLKRY